MIPSRIFRSRWSALFWAGGVVWLAYDVASAAPPAPATGGKGNRAASEDATGEDVTAKDLAILANAMN